MWEYWRTGTVLPQFCVCEGIFHDHGVPLNVQLERICSWSSSFFIKTAVVKHWHLLKLFPFHFSPWVLSLWREWDVALHRSPCRVPGNAEVLIQEHGGCRLPSLTPGYICHLFWQASEDTKDWNCETPVVLCFFRFVFERICRLLSGFPCYEILQKTVAKNIWEWCPLYTEYLLRLLTCGAVSEQWYCF